MSINVSKCLQMSPNVSKYLQMSPNVSKCLQMSLSRHFRDISPYRLHQSLIPNVPPGYMSDLPTCKSKELLQFSNVSSIGFTLLDNIRRERNRAAWRRLERIEYNVVGMYLDVSIVLLTSSAGTNIGFLVQ